MNGERTIMAEKQRVIALGFFDGVHRGHGALLRTARELADERGAIAAAVTFDHHPRDLIRGEPTPLINTHQERAVIMKRYYGTDEVLVLPFDRAMMEMPWREFATHILSEQMGAVHVVAGHDYHFGYKGEGNVDRLREICGEMGIGCTIIPPVQIDGITVSSTYIRGLIAQGDMDRACEFLGHPHLISGTVVHGKQLGRTLGIPTANLVLPPNVLVPAFGVYATRVHVAGETHLAVTNVGVRPTVDDSNQVTVEPWILDFEGDLYGQTMEVELHTHLRGERKFDSLEQLQQEIFRNADQTRAFFVGAGKE